MLYTTAFRSRAMVYLIDISFFKYMFQKMYIQLNIVYFQLVAVNIVEARRGLISYSMACKKLQYFILLICIE